MNSLGGPAGQIGVMHRVVVDERRWVSEERFAHALSFCMLLPGPEAMQLATYLGWLLNGVRGAVTAGLLFIAPGVAVMLALSIVYVQAGTVPLVAALLAGLQAAVVVLVAQACVRMARRTARGPVLAAVATAAFIAITVLGIPFPIIVIAAGLVGWIIGRRQPRAQMQPMDEPSPAQTRSATRAAVACALLWSVPLLAIVLTLGMRSVLAQMAVFFSQAAVVTFGGAYAVLGYVAQQAVGTFGWVTTQDVATGLGLAETTPGPLVLVLQFIGYVGAYENPGDLPPHLAGLLGALVAIWMTFVPCFLFVFAGAPSVERLRGNAALAGALRGIGAAVVGVIAALALWFAMNALFASQQPAEWGPIRYDVPDWDTVRWGSLGIALLAAVLAFGFRWPTLRLLAVCCGAALALAAFGGLT